MAQPDKNLEFKIPPFVDKTGKPEMTVKRYWSWLNTYLFITYRIRIEPLLKKQKEAVEKGKEVDENDNKSNLELALEIFKWVTGQETEKKEIRNEKSSP